MQDIKKIIFKEIGALVSKNNIECYVLNGLTYETSKFGRDLDLFCVSDAHKNYLIKMFKELLLKNGAKWVVDMNPIWGRRCVGVWDDYVYMELHFINPLSSGLFDVTKTFSISGVKGPFGFLFSPWLTFAKTILFAKKEIILNRKPLWADNKCDFFIRDNRDDIIEQLSQYSTSSTKFVSALLGDDNLENLNERCQGYLSLLYRFSIQSPLVAISSVLTALRKKILKNFSPCVPVVVIHSNCNIHDIESKLKNDLFCIFPQIIVKKGRVGIFRLCDLMAKQRLVVLLNNQPPMVWRWLNKKNYIESEFIYHINDLNNIEVQILEKIRLMNKIWDNK